MIIRKKLRLFHYLDLIFYKTYADLRAESERTYVGFLWWLLDPALLMVTFYIVFGILLNQRDSDFLPNLMVGLIVFQWFQNAVSHGTMTIINGRTLMRQVYLPKVIFPIINILADSAKFLFVFCILVALVNLMNHPISWAYLAIPVLWIVELLLIAAVAFFVAAVTPFLPDLRLLFDQLLQLMFFLSGVFFSAETIPEQYRSYFYWNPMASLIESYRKILLRGEFPDGSSLIFVTLFALIGISFSVWLINRFDRVYPKVIS